MMRSGRLPRRRRRRPSRPRRTRTRLRPRPVAASSTSSAGAATTEPPDAARGRSSSPPRAAAPFPSPRATENRNHRRIPPRSTQVVPAAGTSQARHPQGPSRMAGLVLAPPKVARRAVRILVLTVRSATAGRRATPPCLERDWAVLRTHRCGELAVLDRRRVGFPSATQPTGDGTGRTVRSLGRAIGRGSGPGVTGSRPGTIKDGSEVGATGMMAVSRGDPGALLVPDVRRAGSITAPTWFLSGGRRKPPWSRTELGEWSP
jgi:hypothetical protein